MQNIEKKYFTENIIMIEIVKSSNGLLTVKKDGNFLLSSYDPLKEINRYISNLSIKSDEFLILFGNGLGYLSGELSKKYKIYVFLPFEEEREFLPSGVVEITPSNMLDILESELSTGKKPKIVSLESYKKHFNNEYLEFEKMIILNTKIAVENIKVTSFFIKVWFFNFLRNILLGLKRNYKFLENVNNRTDKDILICASGPSLNENIQFIKNHRDKFVLFSVLSAVKTLSYYNIKPDFVFITDGGVANSFYIENLPEDVLIFADVYSSSSFLSKVKNEVVFFNFCDEIENPAFMLKDPSVSISAARVASKITEGKIVFCGFDLAYSKVYGSHSFPNVFTSPFLKRFNRLYKIENYIFSFLKRNDLDFSDRITNKQFMLVKENIKNEFKNFYFLPNITGLKFLKEFQDFSVSKNECLLKTTFISEKTDEIKNFINMLEEKEILNRILMKERIKNINFNNELIMKKIQSIVKKIKTQIQD